MKTIKVTTGNGKAVHLASQSESGSVWTKCGAGMNSEGHTFRHAGSTVKITDNEVTCKKCKKLESKMEG